MNALYTAKVDVRSRRDGAIQSDDGHLKAPLAFPAALGGTGNGTNPEQLFAAGYAACFATSLTLTAKAAGTTLTDVGVTSEVDMLHDGTTWDLAVRLVVRAKGTDRKTLADLVEQTKSVCPYSRATRGSLYFDHRRRGGLMNLSGQHVVVVGGASGIGQSVARLAADRGAAVTVFDVDGAALAATHALVPAARSPSAFRMRRHAHACETQLRDDPQGPRRTPCPTRRERSS